jgi:hypothetical protein
MSKFDEKVKQYLNEDKKYPRIDAIEKYSKPYNPKGKTWEEQGYFLVPKKVDGIFKVYIPGEIDSQWSRGLEFESKKEAEDFLKSKVFDRKKINRYKVNFHDMMDENGEWAVYKQGGFSGNMTDENRHKQYGWHIANFKNKKDADYYALLGNMSLQWDNSGGGRYHVKKDDKTSVAKTKIK